MSRALEKLSQDIAEGIKAVSRKNRELRRQKGK